MSDIATMPIGHINNAAMFSGRFDELSSKLQSLTGLDVNDKGKLIEHLMQFKKDWTLVKVFKAFEYQFSAKCEKPVEAYGKELTVRYMADVLKDYHMYLHSVERSRPRSFVTEPEISPEEKDKLNKAALIAVHQRHIERPGKRYLIAYSKFYELLEHFNLVPAGYYNEFEDEARDVMLRDKVQAKQENDRDRLINIERMLKDNSLQGVCKRLACIEYFNQNPKIEL